MKVNYANPCHVPEGMRQCIEAMISRLYARGVSISIDWDTIHVYGKVTEEERAFFDANPSEIYSYIRSIPCQTENDDSEVDEIVNIH